MGGSKFEARDYCHEGPCRGGKLPLNRYYTYGCHFNHDSIKPGELRSGTIETDTIKSQNMDINVLVAIILLIGIIGFTVGYLLHRKRNKSAAKKVSYDAMLTS